MSGAMSPTHWVIVVGVLVVLFGARKLPDVARGMGQSLRIFKAEIGAGRADRPAAHSEVPGASTAASPASPPAATVDTTSRACSGSRDALDEADAAHGFAGPGAAGPGAADRDPSGTRPGERTGTPQAGTD